MNQVLIGSQVTHDPVTNTFTSGPPELWFDTWAQNLGSYPVELLAGDTLEQSETTQVSQCVSWTATYVCRATEPAGNFSWHEDHGHFHFNDFASYQLRRLTAGGAIDYTSSALIASSDKVSFCLMDTEQVRDDALPIGTYANCSNTRQGITPGWSDIYTSNLPGQNFPIADLADGRYGIVVEMNSAANLHETDYSDNRVEVVVEFSKVTNTAQIISKSRP